MKGNESLDEEDDEEDDADEDENENEDEDEGGAGIHGEDEDEDEGEDKGEGKRQQLLMRSLSSDVGSNAAMPAGATVSSPRGPRHCHRASCRCRRTKIYGIKNENDK